MTVPGRCVTGEISAIVDRIDAVFSARMHLAILSFNTHWNDEGGYIDVDTAIQVHEALEKEFGIDIKDRNILITDVETAYFVVTQHHDAI